MRRAALTFCVLAFLTAGSASAQTDGTIEGALHLDDRPTRLGHVYVVEVSEIPGIR